MILKNIFLDKSKLIWKITIDSCSMVVYHYHESASIEIKALYWRENKTFWTNSILISGHIFVSKWIKLNKHEIIKTDLIIFCY